MPPPQSISGRNRRGAVQLCRKLAALNSTCCAPPLENPLACHISETPMHPKATADPLGNSLNFGDANTVINNPTFGLAESGEGGRTIELQARFQF